MLRRDAARRAPGLDAGRCGHRGYRDPRCCAPPRSAAASAVALILGLGVGFVLLGTCLGVWLHRCLHGRPPPPLLPARRAPLGLHGEATWAAGARPAPVDHDPARPDAAGCSRSLAARPDGRDRVLRLPLQRRRARSRVAHWRRPSAALPARAATGARGRQRQPARHAGQRAGGAAQVGPGADRGLALADGAHTPSFAGVAGLPRSSCTRRSNGDIVHTEALYPARPRMATSARATCIRSSRAR